MCRIAVAHPASGVSNIPISSLLGRGRSHPLHAQIEGLTEMISSSPPESTTSSEIPYPKRNRSSFVSLCVRLVRQRSTLASVLVFHPRTALGLLVRHSKVFSGHALNGAMRMFL